MKLRSLCIYGTLVVVSVASIGFTFLLLNGRIRIPGSTIPKPVNPLRVLAPPIYTDIQYSTKNEGTYYINDTVFLITKQGKKLTLIATATRTSEPQKKTTQVSRASYYDGTSWVRKTDTTTVSDLSIASDSIVKSWNVQMDPGINLRQKASGALALGNTDLAFTAPDLQNEMPTRATPGYTKFLSEGEGTLTVAGQTYDCFVLYSKIYSNNPAEFQVYDDIGPFQTYWIAAWDASGEFYHADITSLQKNTGPYQSHSIGFLKTADNATISKTFFLDGFISQLDGQKSPRMLAINYHTPIDTVVNLSVDSSFQKYTNIGYQWITGVGETTIVDIQGNSKPGRAIFEYINSSVKER